MPCLIWPALEIEKKGAPTVDEPEKSQNSDSFEDSANFKARKSQRREAYLFTPQRLRDAAQRRNWTFCGTVMVQLLMCGRHACHLT
jgi:hypothetical protein